MQRESSSNRSWPWGVGGHRYRRWLASLIVSGGLSWGSFGCEKTETGARPPVEDQWYRASLSTRDGDQIPFFLLLPADCTQDAALIVNGEERIRTDCHRVGSRARIDFRVYGTHISARFTRNGVLSGYWTQELPDQQPTRMPFEARPVPMPDPQKRFPSDLAGAEVVSSGVDLTGVWRVEFERFGVAKGIFEQTPSGVVTGTAMVPSQYGDLRFLAGNLHADRLNLSTFDGRQGLLFKGRLNPDGTMSGELVRGDAFREPFVAERSETLEMPDPLGRISLAAFENATLGETLRNPRYAGKALIVEIFGTWCPHCNDVAPVLAELYRAHHEDGLEMLGIAFEASEDLDYNTRRVRAFKKRHGIDWEIQIAERTLDEVLGSSVEGVPVTIFVNREGSVHAVYSGFSGPAMGEAHRNATAQFRALTSEILNGQSRHKEVE